jgi:DNA-damage-inducible protein D
MYVTDYVLCDSMIYVTPKGYSMEHNLPALPEYSHTMQRLEALKKTTDSGREYWLARDVFATLGYQTWRRFEDVIERARASCRNNKLDPDKHFVRTGKMVGLGSDAQRDLIDYFLSRPACYLIAMNGDPAKVEIAAAQAYFAIQTRRMEIEDRKSEDEKRLELREKATKSFKKVSQQAQASGVRNIKQGVFHDQRYLGLYGKTAREVKIAKGLGETDNLLDHAGALELSAHDFQMNLAADVLAKEGIRHEASAIARNKKVAEDVRQTMVKSGATTPENLALEGHIQDVRKRLTGTKTPKKLG